MAQMRRKAGMNQEEVAEKLGVDRSTVAKWETKAAWPRGSMSIKLAKLYGCTMDELYMEPEGMQA